MKSSTALVQLSLVVAVLGVIAGCSRTQARQPDPTSEPEIGTLQFLESFPEETGLDLPEFSEAHIRWPQILAEATNSIRVASFYYSRIGDGKDPQAPSGVSDQLVPSLNALVSAADRGVRVQVLGDSKFQKTYPAALAWLDGFDGLESRVINVAKQWGGVMHAKYFVVDEKTLFVGSQNWDWRAMTQIRELGALVTHRKLAQDLKRIFELDWALAGGQTLTPEVHPTERGFADLPHAQLETPDGRRVTAVLAASPPAGLPAGVSWDLPLIVELIDSAQESIHLQLLSYNVSDREGRYFPDLDNALRRAAARKVQVNILLSNWAKVHYKLHWIQSLAAVHNIEVKFSNIPEHSQGHIPFGRVEHPKYLIADGQRAWVGTSNWSRDYFHSSRNISLILHGEGAALPLERFFDQGWHSAYSEIVNPAGQYEPPRRK